MRLHHSAAHAGAESASGLFGQICSEATPRVSRKSKGAGTLLLPANAVPITAVIYYTMKMTLID